MKKSLSFSKEPGQLLPNDLFNYWPDLTAKLRIGKCLMPKTASDCSGTQGNTFCGDNNGAHLNENSKNADDKACCSASNKVVLDGVCFTPCGDNDKDNYGIGEMCTKATDCDDSNGNIHSENINPFCDCNLNDNGIDKGTAEICNDGIDNDCDGNVDASDNDCVLPPTAGCVITDKFCPNGRGVLSLYKESNSNAAEYGKAPLNLCCSDKSNANCQYSCTFNTRESGSLDVIGLYEQENSHVADTNTREGSSLDNKIYCRLSGDCGNKFLSDCQFYSRSTGNNCPPDTVSKSYQCIASAYSTTNAHLAECNYYNYNICCETSLR